MSELFPGLHEHRVETDGAQIFVRTGGAGPPLLLVHGFPQTHAMWHKIVPEVSKNFTGVLVDLLGYVLASCAKNDSENRAYSKRVMGTDLFQVMSHLGYERFAVAG